MQVKNGIDDYIGDSNEKATPEELEQITKWNFNIPCYLVANNMLVEEDSEEQSKEQDKSQQHNDTVQEQVTEQTKDDNTHKKQKNKRQVSHGEGLALSLKYGMKFTEMDLSQNKILTGATSNEANGAAAVQSIIEDMSMLTMKYKTFTNLKSQDADDVLNSKRGKKKQKQGCFTS